MLDDRLDQGFEALIRHGLTLDILVQDWRELPLATLIARRWPPVLSVVLDHCGKPDIAGVKFDPWANAVGELASLPNVACKLAGLMNCARPGAATADIAPYATHALATVGPNRVMWASVWPPLE